MSVKARTRTAKRKHTSTVTNITFALLVVITVVVAVIWGLAESANTKPSIAYLAFLNVGWVATVVHSLWTRTHRSSIN